MGLYHFKPTGTKTSGVSIAGDFSDSNCYGSVSTLMALNPSGGPHLVLFTPGTSVNFLATTNAAWGGSTFFGISPTGMTGGCNSTNYTSFPASKGAILFDTPNSIISLSISCNVANICGKNTTANTGGLYLTAGAINVDNVHIEDCGRLVYLPNTGATNIKNSSFCGSTDAVRNGLTASGTGTTLNINNCIFGPSSINPLNPNFGFNLGSSGAINIFGTVIRGATSTVIDHSAGTIVFKNNIVGPPLNRDTYVVWSHAGAFTSDANIYTGGFSTVYPHRVLNGVTPGTRDIINANPRWRGRQKQGIISLNIDDYVGHTIGYVAAIEALMAAKGRKMTWFVNGNYTGTELAVIREYSDRGTIDIGLHGIDHSRWNYTGDVWSITKSAETITVDRETNTISLSGGGVVTGFKEKTLGAIKIELESAGATVTPTTIYGDTGTLVRSATLGEALANGTGAATLKTDDPTGATGYFKTQMKTQYDQFISAFGYAPSAAPPGGGTSADVELVAQNLGFLSLRNGDNQADKEFTLSSIDMYQTTVLTIEGTLTNNTTATEAEIKNRTRAFCEYTSEFGHYWSLVTHNAGHATVEQMGWIINIIVDEYPELLFLDSTTAARYIRSGEWATVDNRTYTRTWDNAPDYHLQANSPCIGAGVSVPTIHEQATPVTDFGGKMIQFLPPSIGPYDGQGDVYSISENTINNDFSSIDFLVLNDMQGLITQYPSAGGSGTITIDTTVIKNGSQSVRLTPAAASNINVDIPIPNNLLPNGDNLHFFIYINENIAANSFTFYVSNSNWSKFFTKGFSCGGLKIGWNHLQWAKSDFSTSNGAVWTAVDKLRVRATTTGGGTFFACITGVYWNAKEKAKFIFDFDDGFVNVYNTVFPYMKTAGFPGVMYALSGVNPGTYMSIAQLTEMQDAGWDICNHTNLHENLSTLTLEAAKATIMTCKKWLIAHGFGKGACHLAYPVTLPNAIAIQAASETGMKTARTVFGDRYYTEMRDDMLEIVGRGVSQGISLATITSDVDTLIAKGGTYMIYAHDVANGGAANQWPIADMLGLIDYVKIQSDAGLLDVMTLTEWYKDLRQVYAPTGYSVRGIAASPAKIKLGEHDLNVDLSGLTDAAPYIQVKASSKRVAGFIGKGTNTYVKGSGGGSGNGIFGSNFD